jgi:hypothetical protein
MVFEKKMSVKDLIEQMREELRTEQEAAGVVEKPKKKGKAKPVKAKKAKAKPKTKKKKK